LQRCHELLNKDDLIAANDCYGKAILKYPLNALEISKHGQDVVFKKCVEFEERENYEQAIVCFEGMTVLSPDKPIVYIHLAENYYQDHKTFKDKTGESLRRAEEAIKKAIELRAESAIVHNTYGRILEEKQDYQGALAEHRKAIKLNPDVTIYLIDLALLQEKLNDFSGALESYQRALTIDPNDTAALWFAGLLYEKTGKFAQALEMFEKHSKLKSPKQETLQKINELKRRVELVKPNQKPLKSKTKTQGN
jgi:tetratricopeptide (TPR) repeat protein